jgi:heme A synthase
VAATEGRLTAEELEDRLGALFSSRTYGELDALTADLPSKALAPRRRRLPVRAVSVAALALLAAIGSALGGLVHRSAEVVARGGHPQPFPLGGAAGDPHHGIMVAASMVALLAVALAAAAIVWVLRQARAPRDA